MSFRGRKGGKPYPITPRKGRSAFEAPQNESLAEEVHAQSVEDATASSDVLMSDFHHAKTKVHRKEVWRATQLEANRLKIDSRNNRNSVGAREQDRKKSEVFQAKATEMHNELEREGAFEGGR